MSTNDILIEGRYFCKIASKTVKLKGLVRYPAAPASKIPVTPDEHTNCAISDVFFELGVRNNWHIHSSNQILIVKERICYYQEEGQPVRKLSVGEVINILPGIRHWHGASPDDKMVHLAININSEKGTVNWLEPVTDEQYAGKA